LKYVRVTKWSAQDDGIHLEMLGEDDQIHSFEVSTECAGALAAGLAAELEKTNARGNGQQFIRPKSLQTGKTAQGEPMLFMTLEGGTELPLVFKAESLGLLISELEKLRSILQPGDQIRWN
jgi:hypothetical protein